MDKKTKRHAFNFEGGEQLTTIGATFFVSYLYYLKIDKTHKNWTAVKTHKSRISTIDNNAKYHKIWLEHVGLMNKVNLSRNTMGLDGVTVKKMAGELLQRYFL